MPCTLLDLATARVMPWKNGGGETLELAIAPAGAGLEDFAWRISSARGCACSGATAASRSCMPAARWRRLLARRRSPRSW
ncbi:HutD protein [Ectopseudomonas toyotomiensis]|uniref:HutD protein n=1 Tax=Ectopseudomonas toyotomiensis TaxID=554344 RepID=A0A1I5WQT1_9GAMM|nr:HutD protein [Pseudomonas toyotomiensis]